MMPQGYFSQPQGYWSTQYVPARTNHILHLVLTLVTLGLWLPVWFVVWLYNNSRMVPMQIWNQLPGPIPTTLHQHVTRQP